MFECFLAAAYANSTALSQSFKNEAALHDPFAELQPIQSSAGPAAMQVSPPLKELSPGQQKYNLGACFPLSSSTVRWSIHHEIQACWS